MSRPISIHHRSYETEAFDEGNGTMRLVGRLVDTKPQGLGMADGEPLVIHDMIVEMIVAGDTFEILDITTTMQVRPYGQCTQVLDSYQQLVGVSIARGYSRKVKELFGGPMGCSHVGALLIALAPVAVQASWGLARLHDDPAVWSGAERDEADAERRTRLNTNTCHVWSADGEQIARLNRGEEAERPEWEAVRLTKLGL
ncbi:DUF2889 domain-containing protein [bacterium]|jgi:hypothetical protein|nr:DUF2889 domain-containing protein [bacterium]